MLRGLPHLCKYASEPRDARRRIPDPDHEPDFYELDLHHPLPTTASSSSSVVQTMVATGNNKEDVDDDDDMMKKPAAKTSHEINSDRSKKEIESSTASVVSQTSSSDRLQKLHNATSNDFVAAWNAVLPDYDPRSSPPAVAATMVQQQPVPPAKIVSPKFQPPQQPRNVDLRQYMNHHPAVTGAGTAASTKRNHRTRLASDVIGIGDLLPDAKRRGTVATPLTSFSDRFVPASTFHAAQRPPPFSPAATASPIATFLASQQQRTCPLPPKANQDTSTIAELVAKTWKNHPTGAAGSSNPLTAGIEYLIVQEKIRLGREMMLLNEQKQQQEQSSAIRNKLMATQLQRMLLQQQPPLPRQEPLLQQQPPNDTSSVLESALSKYKQSLLVRNATSTKGAAELSSPLGCIPPSADRHPTGTTSSTAAVVALLAQHLRRQQPS